MKRSRLLLIVGLYLFSVGVRGQSSDIPYVVLVSFDGFRYDYADKFEALEFQEIKKSGSYSRALTPSYPSKTFPNHYSIVTGLTPGHHGLVDNQFYDRKIDKIYSMSDTSKVRDSYFYKGKPIWQLAKENNIKSASYFWVGSEVNDAARRPDYTFNYDEAVPADVRINQIISWLSLPESQRPHFISLYFSFPDHEGHDFGPGADETKRAVLRADSVLATLRKKLNQLNLPVNLIIVSDHGMKELITKEETFIFIDEWIDPKKKFIKVANGGTQAHIYTRSSAQTDSIYRLLEKDNPQFLVYKKDDVPSHWKYDSDRVGDILLIAKPGYYIRKGKREAIKDLKIGSPFGVHGYDPNVVKDMKGIFFAVGPNIKKGVELPPFQNIHIYPLIAKILRLPLPSIDGKRRTLDRIYKK